MKSRRQARETALRALYELEIGAGDAAETFDRAIEDSDLAQELQDYARQLAQGVLDNHGRLDQDLAGYVKEYEYSRLAAIDRNILRIATFEIQHLPEVPPAVSINEAIELAKLYSTAESGKFVNGVLARVLKDSSKADWDPRKAPPEEVPPPVVAVPVEEVIDGTERADEVRALGQWRLGGPDDA